MDIETLTRKLEKAWSRESSQRPKTWTPGNPSWGQSDVTVLCVRMLLGGRIKRSLARIPDDQIFVHYYSILESGRLVDLTWKQYPKGTILHPAIMNAPLYPSAITRCLLLMSALDSSESRNL